MESQKEAGESSNFHRVFHVDHLFLQSCSSAELWSASVVDTNIITFNY